MYENLFIALLSVIPVIVFNYYNQYRSIERWYYRTDKKKYLLMQICYYILILSAIFNARFLAYKGIEYGLKRFFKIDYKIV